jgi:NAD(P)H-dependent FMN reductase
MVEPGPRIMAVTGSLQQQSVTRVVILHLAKRLEGNGLFGGRAGPEAGPLPLYNPTPPISSRVRAPARAGQRADVFVLGSPDYHGSIAAR